MTVIEQITLTIIQYNDYFDDPAKKLFQWFSDNQRKKNTNRCYLILSKKADAEICVIESFIKYTTCQKLLGSKIDQDMTCDNDVNSLCKTANGKLKVVT